MEFQKKSIHNSYFYLLSADFCYSTGDTDTDLDNILPQEGYKIVEPPADYKPVSSRLKAVETPLGK